MALSVVILAAGKGTRMRSNLPKVLHPIAGKPIVKHILDTVQQLGAQQLNLIYGHGAEQLQAALPEAEVNWCLQAQQLGTGHAVMQALPHIRDEDDILILVGDVPLIQQQTLARMQQAKQAADLVLLTVDIEDPTGLGRIIRNEQQVTAIVEHKDCTEEQLAITETNTGMMLMGGADLRRWLGQLSNDNAQQEYYLTDVIAMAAAEGKTIVSSQPDTPEEVAGINNRVQLAQLECAYQNRMAEQLMLSGVTLIDPHRVDVRGEVQTGIDVTIDVNVILQGRVNIGNDVTIGANCILIDCTIADGAVIEANSIVQEAQVGAGCVVGPYARLRPGSVMQAKSKVGNFVEMKKTTLGEGAKANHLTYLGDCTVGAKANIGAGTITCNYDGVNKFKTDIGAGAFVGSNSSLVAPVVIGDNATVGAGSVITKAVPAEQLALSRAKQSTIKNWKRPTKK